MKPLADVVIGLQWGDEGKGKIVDIIAPNYDAIIRANGGNNAGHSISANGKDYAVHILPSGVLQKNKLNIIASGCVIDPRSLVKEIETLKDDFVGDLVISERCPLILNKYIQEDRDLETKKGTNAVGTTLRGIGPTYAALKNRTVVFAGDLLDIDSALTRFSYLPNNELESLRKELEEYKNLIGNFVKDVFSMIHKQNNVLLEGAQATMLDNLYGAYPFVTSSNTIVSGLLTGSSLNHKNVRDVIGVTKAYTTRVGNGPFITEETGDIGEKIRTIGKEIGVSTGRKRRCGWLDLVQLKYAIQLNGVTKLSIMKSDVLDSFEEIKVCVNYRHKETGEIIDYVPFRLSEYEAVYKSFKGWMTNTYGETNAKKLPDELMEYLNFIEKELKTPIAYISTGPKREQICII